MSIAAAGEYETCMLCPAKNEDEHDDMRQTTDEDEALENGLFGACEAGHLELAYLMIAKGAEDFNNGLYGLYWACKGGHPELIDFMLFQRCKRIRLGVVWCVRTRTPRSS